MPSNILVTGGAGYVGSRLIRDLAARPEPPGRIRILDNLQRGSHAGLMGLPAGPSFELHQADLLDPAALRYALDGMDCVIHLAALARTPFSFDHPSDTRHVNHWGTSRLVEECIQAGVRRFVYVSSASVYGPGGPFQEDSPCRPMGPYSQSKLAAEHAVLAASGRMNVTVFRAGIVFGQAPAIRYEAVPNHFAFLAGTGRPVTIFGDGEQVRPIVHVGDLVAAILLRLDDAPTGEVLNVVADNLTVREMADAARRLRPFVRVVHSEQDAMTRFSLSVRSERIRALGWKPSVTLEAGLEEMLGALGPFAPRTPVHDPLLDP